MKIKFSFCLLLTLFFKLSFAQKKFEKVDLPYDPGYYFTHDNKRVDGFMLHRFQAKFSDSPDNFVYFKPSQGAKKVKLTTKEMKCFVIAGDSFAIVTNFALSAAYYTEDFAKVIAEGKIILYEHYTTGGAESFLVSSLLIKKDGGIHLYHREYFKENYEELFKGYDVLLKRIRSKELRYGDIIIIVEDYNNWYKGQKAVGL